jgi:hypothetical protein
MEIKILGTGCPKCKTLEKVTRDTVTEMGIDAQIQKEEDIVKVWELSHHSVPVRQFLCS